MKTLLLVLVTMLTINLSAQDGQSNIANDTLTVKGNCGECEERIENAALIKGVKLAEWDKTTDKLVIIYRTDKVTLEEIVKSILTTGHDVEDKTGDDSAYADLPRCCQYKTGGTCTED